MLLFHNHTMHVHKQTWQKLFLSIWFFQYLSRDNITIMYVLTNSSFQANSNMYHLVANSLWQTSLQRNEDTAIFDLIVATHEILKFIVNNIINIYITKKTILTDRSSPIESITKEKHIYPNPETCTI